MISCCIPDVHLLLAAMVTSLLSSLQNELHSMSTSKDMSVKMRGTEIPF